MSRKLEELRSKYGVTERAAALIDRIDLTTTKKYVEWLFKVRYTHVGGGKYRVSEDFPASAEGLVRDGLTWFERNLNGKIPTEFRDINKFKTVTEFVSKVQELMTPSRTDIKNDVRIVFEDDNWKILIPLSFESSKLYGTGTKWCTTQKTYYDNYMRDGFLYYIIDKRIDRKFGLPINKNKGMNVNPSSFQFYNNEDCGLTLAEVKLVYGNFFDTVVEKVRLDFIEQLKIILRAKYLREARVRVQTTQKEFSSLGIENPELDKLLVELINKLNGLVV